jgi:2-polyprenyl-6-methoxyphenol hydroxylase-like FAD-dependent oxidoreductase
MRNETDVLIVGAGPAGLMMACQLALRNIPFRIIDKKSFGVQYSGALIIHARSLEIFHQMGIAQSAIESGILANEIKLVFNGTKSVILPVKDIGKELTQFPHLLMLEQSKTEQILADYIQKYGHSIERETELIRFTQDADGVTSFLNDANGGTEVIKTKYLIAADGAHSTVRKQLKIPFAGTSDPISLFVTDCISEADFQSDQICFSFSEETTAGFFPLPGGRWRIDGVISSELAKNDPIFFMDIAKNIADKTRINVKISQPGWFSTFQVNERCAQTFQQNKCFLVGDAAHIHSPVGAQGMNTGLQDSCNLAWKLEMVINGRVRAELLNSYSSERKVVAKNVVRGTHRAFNFLTSRNFILKWVRVYALPFILQPVLPLLIKQKVIRSFVFKRISGIGVQYRKNSFSHQTSLGRFRTCAPKPGDRLPYLRYWEYGQDISIQDQVDGTSYLLMIFSKSNQEPIVKMAEKYSAFLSVQILPSLSNAVESFKQMGIIDYGCFLIRPDLYISYRSSKPDLVHLESYLQQISLIKR